MLVVQWCSLYADQMAGLRQHLGKQAEQSMRANTSWLPALPSLPRYQTVCREIFGKLSNC